MAEDPHPRRERKADRARGGWGGDVPRSAAAERGGEAPYGGDGDTGRNDTGRRCLSVASAPRDPSDSRAARGSGRRPHRPAARSWSRSTAAGECSALFPFSRAGSSWRRATVRVATMAAMATRLTPKVRISASRGVGTRRLGRAACDEITASSMPNERSNFRYTPSRFRDPEVHGVGCDLERCGTCARVAFFSILNS